MSTKELLSYSLSVTNRLPRRTLVNTRFCDEHSDAGIQPVKGFIFEGELK